MFNMSYRSIIYLLSIVNISYEFHPSRFSCPLTQNQKFLKNAASTHHIIDEAHI